MSSNPGTLKFLPAQIAALNPSGKPYDVADPAVPNLLLRLGPTGTKRWLFRYQSSAPTQNSSPTTSAHRQLASTRGVMQFDKPTFRPHRCPQS